MADVASGLEGLDLGALSPEQQAQLMEFKINTRIANEKYLRSHKEVELLLSGFLRTFYGSRASNEDTENTSRKSKPVELRETRPILSLLKQDRNLGDFFFAGGG
nr:RIIa domain-containing protein 1 isoform X1 [Caretta caretta]